MKLSHWTVLAALAVALGAALRRVEAPLAAALDPTPARGGVGLVMRVVDDVSRARLFTVAASVGFYALLSIVPTLAAAVSLVGMFADPVSLADAPNALGSLLPAEAVALVQGEAQRLAAQPLQALSLKLGVALALSVWSASAAVRALFDALNVIEAIEETRPFLRRYATALAVTLGGVVVLALAGAIIGANTTLLAKGPFSQETLFLYGALRWPLFFCVGVAAIALLYRVGPSRAPASFARLLPGAAFAAFWWAAGSSAFGWYVATLANYTATYGSLATVAILMTWLWLSAAIVLLGAEVNLEINRGAR
jgi:membrane protein